MRDVLLNRRLFLGDMATGLGGIAMASLLLGQQRLGQAADAATPIRPLIDPAHPQAARQPHFAARAQNVIVVFCSGACSHVDTFDFKPELIQRDGQPLPGGNVVTFQGEQGNLTQSPWKFHPRGESGKMVSELVDHLGNLADDLCFIHSMTSKTNTHGPGENFMSTGYTLDGFPSMGAWVIYALGSENQNLPAFVAIPDPRGKPQASVNNWGPGFLPAVFQGTDFNASQPIRNLARPASIDASRDEATRQYLQRRNQQHLQQFPEDDELAARIASYELAAKMQLSVPEVSDISREPGQILALYGADDAQNPLKAAYAQLYPGSPPDRAGRAIRSTVQRRLPDRWRRNQQLGRAQSPETTVRCAWSHSGSADRRTTDRSETTRPLAADAGRLVHGIWPHAYVSEGRQWS